VRRPPTSRSRFDELAGLRGHFHLAEKKGYAGVGIYTRHEPSDVVDRLWFNPSSTPKGGTWSCASTRRQTQALAHLRLLPQRLLGRGAATREVPLSGAVLSAPARALKAQREFIVCGDVNIAHQQIDLKNWRSNQKNSGFLPEERAWMTKLLEQGQFVDVYRQLQPTATDTAYTWWSNRGQAYANNVGWRLDYHLATPALAALARSESIYKAQKFSDHAPISVQYAFTL
jgi:exodeoxyribonuclease-3